MIDAVNGGEIDLSVFFDNAILYPNCLMTLDPHGYTKHYFAGSERIATVIGGGGFCEMIHPTDHLGGAAWITDKNVRTRGLKPAGL